MDCSHCPVEKMVLILPPTGLIPGQALECDSGHRYMILIHEKICNVSMYSLYPEIKTKKDEMLNLSFIGCDCDRVLESKTAKGGQSWAGDESFSFAVKETDSATQHRQSRNLRVLTDKVVAKDSGAAALLEGENKFTRLG